MIESYAKMVEHAFMAMKMVPTIVDVSVHLDLKGNIVNKKVSEEKKFKTDFFL